MAENRPLTSIRGIAALWVVGYHLTVDFPDAPAVLPHLFGLGFAGVDLFFVLSGFILITVHPHLSVREWRHFMLRRVCRVYPLHLAIMALLACAVLAAGLARIQLAAGGHYDWFGFVPAAMLVKWLVPGPGSWNAPSWSIAAELLCYAALPFAAPRLARSTTALLWIGSAMLAIAAGVWLGGVLAMFANHPGDAMLNWPGVVRGALGFGLGTFLATLAAGWRGDERFRTRAWLLEVIACGLLALTCVFGRVEPVPAISGLLIVALSLDAGPLARLLSVAPLHWLGRVSFSIYLLHAPVISVLAKLPWGRLPTLLIAPARGTLVLVVVLVGAAVTNRWIEEPGRRLPGRVPSWRSLVRRHVGSRLAAIAEERGPI